MTVLYNIVSFFENISNKIFDIIDGYCNEGKSEGESKSEHFIKEFIDKTGGIPLPRTCGFEITVMVYERPKSVKFNVNSDIKSTDDKVTDDNPSRILHSGNNFSPEKFGVAPTKEVEFILASKELNHDKFMSNVGRVIQVGPNAYKGERYKGCAPYCEVGDWIVFVERSGTAFSYGGIPCRTMHDDKCLLVIEDPSYISRV